MRINYKIWRGYGHGRFFEFTYWGKLPRTQDGWNPNNPNFYVDTWVGPHVRVGNYRFSVIKTRTVYKADVPDRIRWKILFYYDRMAT